MPSPVHIVQNLRARRLAEDGPLRAAIRAAAGRNACILHETTSLDALAAAARAIAGDGARAVVLAGGDGTYMAGLTALRRAFGESKLPPIALAPGGTVSTVARNHGMRGPLPAYAARAIDAACAQPPRVVAVPTIHVTDDAGGDRIGFIFGAGLVARFFDLYEAGGARGYAGAARIVARIFASSFVAGDTARRVLTPAPARLVVDNEEQPARAYSLIVAAAVKDLGLGMRVTYRAGSDRSRVHLVASALGPRALGPQMPLVLFGRRLRGAMHVDALAREATLDLEDARAPYVLDGDVFHARRIGVRAGPEISLVIA